MATGEIRLAGWVETRWSGRRRQYQSRLRYRPDPKAAAVSVEEVWHEGRDDENAKTVGREQLAAAQLELTQRLHRAQLPSRARGEATTLEDFRRDVWRPRVWANLPANSQSDHEQQWNRWINPLVGGVPLADFDPDLGQVLIEEMQRQRAGVPTIEKVVNLIRGYLSDAIKWGWLKSEEGQSPWRHLELPRREFAEEIEFALELEHVELIAWMTVGLRHALWAELIGCEALRQQELAPLKFSDLLRPDGTPLTRMKVTKAVSGKGRPDPAKRRPGRQIKELKNRRGRRVPELFPSVADLVVLLREEEGADITRRVFSSDSFDGLPDIDNWRDDFWTPALERAGIEQDGRYGHLTPHRLRGAAASAYAYARWSEGQLMLHVGHKQFTTTLDWYIRAQENPRNDLDGTTVDQQIRRGRELALERLREWNDQMQRPKAFAALVKQAERRVADATPGDPRARKPAEWHQAQKYIADLRREPEVRPRMIAALERLV